ncbi:hypothetical protein TMatcc_010142 [Talaromyces marneffei ATCC 18224]
MKSIEMCCHGLAGIGNGCNNPGGCLLLVPSETVPLLHLQNLSAPCPPLLSSPTYPALPTVLGKHLGA